MNHNRAMAVLDNQSSLAKRIFKCVPLQEWWTIHQIANEMDRQGPHNHSKSVLGGCLTTLKEAGLIDEGPKDTYRSAVKPQVKKAVEPMGQIDDKTASVTSTLTERLMTQASKMREQAEVLDLLAMEIDDEIAKAGKAGSEKLQLLRELLAS